MSLTLSLFSQYISHPLSRRLSDLVADSAMAAPSTSEQPVVAGVDPVTRGGSGHRSNE
jgi:hypothetical protein